jgi:large subunit ribosomal protein L17
MKHRVRGRKLGRTSAHRLALLRNMTTALFEHERITTTLVKAKELRPFAEKLVTLSKRETLHARRRVLRHVHDRSVVAKLFDTLSARYAERPGGYTRIMRLGPRRGDNAEMAIIELVGAETAASKASEEAGKGASAKAGGAKASGAKPAAKRGARRPPKAEAADEAGAERPKRARRAGAEPKDSTKKPARAKSGAGARPRSRGSQRTGGE